MGLGSALVDRARVIRNASASDARVAGSTVLATIDGAWFRARLELPAGTEGPAPENGRTRGVRSPTLMYEVYDEVNEHIDLTADDRVEVNSQELGRTMWIIVAPPQPIRKKRRVIGWQTTLRRIDNRQLTRSAPLPAGGP
jgi:hypothetical protein